MLLTSIIFSKNIQNYCHLELHQHMIQSLCFYFWFTTLNILITRIHLSLFGVSISFKNGFSLPRKKINNEISRRRRWSAETFTVFHILSICSKGWKKNKRKIVVVSSDIYWSAIKLIIYYYERLSNNSRMMLKLWNLEIGSPAIHR